MELLKVGRESLIDEVARNVPYSRSECRKIYEALESVLFEKIGLADENTSVIVNLFEGLKVKSTYDPPKEKKNNLTGEVIKTIGKIKPKALFTKNFCKKLYTDT